MGRIDYSRQPASFILPDLVSHCRYKLAYNPHGDDIAKEHVKWLDTCCPELSPKARRAMHGLQAGELTAYTYTSATAEHLRVIADFLGYLFHLDNISDGMKTREEATLANVVMNALWFPEEYRPTKEFPEEPTPGKLARDFWARCIKDCGPGAQARFRESMGLFFEAVNIQAKARDSGEIPTLESYINVRRDTSGCKPCWALIEYAVGIDLPDYVAEHPVIEALGQYTNDLVTWSNDLFSYNVEQSHGDTHNMIVILMKHHNHSLQSAVDYVGQLCTDTINNFELHKGLVPSWGVETDKIVVAYIQGLQDWIVGSLHWSFQTQRYFGLHGMVVKKNRQVRLLPLRKKQPTSQN